MLQARLSDKTKIYTSKRLLEYRTETDTAEPIELVFDDGSTGRADIVIGADGVHSTTRAKMYRLLQSPNQESGSYDKFIDPIWSGTYAYRAQVDLVKFKEKYPDHQALDNPRIVRTTCGLILQHQRSTSGRLFYPNAVVGKEQTRRLASSGKHHSSRVLSHG